MKTELKPGDVCVPTDKGNFLAYRKTFTVQSVSSCGTALVLKSDLGAVIHNVPAEAVVAAPQAPSANQNRKA
jgi:hypothetical protein